MSAAEVTAALAEGIATAGGEADLCPLADGGEGTMAAFLDARGGETFQVEVHDPLGRPIGASFALLAGGTEAVLDSAAASGLALLEPDERDPLRASSAGTGELIAAALAAGAERVLIAAGGSATVDGGRGTIEALGAATGAEAALVVLCDVQTRYEDAARMFGPQKGADAAAVRTLAARLAEFAATLPRDPRGRPMTGAAGGLSGGLWAACGAELVPGAERILDLVDFDARLRRADLVLTGEGRLDEQSLEGKLVGTVANRCAAAGRALAIVAGSVALAPERLGAAPLHSIEEAGTVAELRAAGRGIATALGARD